MLEYPDVSHYTPVKLTGAPAAVAKATQGATYVDPTYANHRKQAAALGIPFSAYHWFDNTDPTAQQRLASGDAVNVAARLEQSAPAGQVLLGPETRLLVRDAVRVERLQHVGCA